MRLKIDASTVWQAATSRNSTGSDERCTAIRALSRSRRQIDAVSIREATGEFLLRPIVTAQTVFSHDGSEDIHSCNDTAAIDNPDFNTILTRFEERLIRYEHLCRWVEEGPTVRRGSDLDTVQPNGRGVVGEHVKRQCCILESRIETEAVLIAVETVERAGGR